MAYDRSTSSGLYERLSSEAAAMLSSPERVASLPDVFKGFLDESKALGLYKGEFATYPDQFLDDTRRRSKVCDYIIMMLCMDAAEIANPENSRVPRESLVTALGQLAGIEEQIITEEISSLTDSHWVVPTRAFVASTGEVEAIPALSLNFFRFEFTEDDLQAIRSAYPNIEELKLAS